MNDLCDFQVAFMDANGRMPSVRELCVEAVRLQALYESARATGDDACCDYWCEIEDICAATGISGGELDPAALLAALDEERRIVLAEIVGIA